MRLLIVEDDVELNNVLCKRLKIHGFICDQAFNGEECLDFIDATTYDLVIMDVMMPRMNGYDTVKKIRENGVSIPVIFLTARDSEVDIIKGLTIGADDYLVKPFSFDVLLARIQVLIRRSDNKRDNIYKIKDLVIDTTAHIVTRAGEVIVLSNKEYELLFLLVRNKNRVVTREQIIDSLYGFDSDNESNVLDVHVRNLRKKIDKDHPYNMIETIRSVGYVIRD